MIWNARWKWMAVWAMLGAAQGKPLIEQTNGRCSLGSDHYRLEIEMAGFRFRILDADGKVVAPMHPVSGLQFGSVAGVDLGVPSGELQTMTQGRVHDVKMAKLVSSEDGRAVFDVTTTAGDEARVEVQPLAHRIRMSVTPKTDELHAILFRTGGVAPSYGLSDHGSMGRSSAEVSGFSSDYMGARTAEWVDHREGRLISNFVIHPRQGLGAINVEPRKKIIRLTEGEAAHGSSASRKLKAMYYIVGDTKRIYQELQEIRAAEGHPFHTPKPDLFGVGWEAFGALGWTTSAATVEENISTYLDLGYPLSWMVIGSGFWPSGSSELWGTTSFGMWDKQKYPEPEAFLKTMEDRGLSTLLGLRIAFRKGNPFAKEAHSKGFLITDDKGHPKVFSDRGWDSYLLNFEDPKAVDWYMAQCQKWIDAGVDGFKEDLMFFLDDLERDDKADEVNRRLSQDGQVVMLRNNYLGSPGDLHRYNDFNFYESQDRGPINGLCLSYSGFPYVYPDIVGGTKVWTEMEKGNASPEVVATYMMRYAEYAAVHPSMSFGYGPWSLGRKDVIEVTRNAAQLHHRLTPYIFSAALKTAETGFPYTMTPLPLAYPEDPEVYGLANTTRRSYQWLLGESLMAVPLYGDDYATANSRDVYLPEGRWVEYDTGKMFTGPKTLDDYPLPIGKTPLFVGGKGVVIEEAFGRLFAKVFPVKNETEFVFRDKEGKASHITVKVDDWEKSPVQVRSGGAVLPTESQRGAMVFPIEPGTDYEVVSIPMPKPASLVKPTKRKEVLPN
ncbi:MAG: TIM-barrel domain-containing protein [Haloferula sp.]